MRRLALLGSAGHAGPRRPRGELRNWKAEAASGDPQRLAAVMRHKLSVHMLHASAQDIDPLAVHVHTWSCLRTRFRSREVAQSSDVRRLLATLPAELLMAWGAHDVTADPAWLVRNPPTDRATPHIIDGAGHWVQYERATEVNALLLDWLAPTTPARSS